MHIGKGQLGDAHSIFFLYIFLIVKQMPCARTRDARVTARHACASNRARTHPARMGQVPDARTRGSAARMRKQRRKLEPSSVQGLGFRV